jgi:hypothetical protein
MAKQYPALDRIIDIIDGIGETGAEEIRLTGGEPVLHPDFFSIVSHAKAAGLRVSCITNGTLLTSGGSTPTLLDAPALSAQPGVLVNNWHANNLSVTNVSLNQQTPIWISAFGPGVPGQTSMRLPTNGTPVPLATGQSAQGTALPQYMQLGMQSATPTLCIFGIIGGPTDATGNNGYVIAVNASANTGPGTGNPPPTGYFATTTSNAYSFQFNWGGATVYVVNLSPATASGAQVLLRSL